MTTAYSGKDLSISWIYSGGTVDLAGDYTTFGWSPSVELYDQSAGADANKSYVVGLKDGQMSYAARLQAGGTVLYNALDAGTEGTLIWRPEGTATGKPSYTAPAISMGAKINIPYNGLVELTCDFQANGAVVKA